MVGGASVSSATGNVAGVRIVVAGDAKTGKLSLIVTAATENYRKNVPPLLPPTRLPEDVYPDRVPITVIDTSSSPENRGRLVEELMRADVVVLTYACDRLETLDRLSTFCLPELRRLEVKVPVIVVGCMLDKRDDQHPVSLEQVMSPIMQQFREIETCIECSALNHIQIPEVFYYAQKAVLHPTAPLFDQEQQVLRPRRVRALKRIFILCDHDRDGALCDAELNDFQGRLETTWTVLRKFGYNNEIRLRDDQLPLPIKRYPDQWSLMTLLDPIRTMETLIYIGYGGDPSTAIRVTRRRRLDRRKQQTDRTVYHCFVFGPKEAGKSAILNSFIGRLFSEEYVPTTNGCYAVNSVDQPGGENITLVLREIPEAGLKKIFSSRDALAACDVAVFVHDRSHQASWQKATEMLLDVASQGETTGYEVPCLIVDNKDDLDPCLTEIQDSTLV